MSVFLCAFFERRLHIVPIVFLITTLVACGGGPSNVPPVERSLDAARPSAVATGAGASVDATTQTIAINAGGKAVAGWIADTAYSGTGQTGTYATSAAINTSHVSAPAPQAVYQTQRYATHLVYGILRLTANANYSVRLHFVESTYHAAGERVFNVRLNGVTVASRFDVYAAAGGANLALVKQYTVRANSSGEVRIELDAVTGTAAMAGLAVAPESTPAPTPSPAPAPTNYAHGNLPPPGWQFPYAPNPFTLAACAADPCSPELDPSSTSEVAALMQDGLDLGDIFEGPATDNDFPIYYATSSDPVYTVSCNLGGCGSGTITVNIPNGAYASGGSDHHLTVVNVSAGTEADFWEFNNGGTSVGSTKPVSGGGKLVAGAGGMCIPTSFFNHTNTCAGSSNGSSLPMQPLMLDPREIIAAKVNHTLYVAIACGAHAFAFPSRSSDGVCSSGPKYGQRIWLDLTDAQIDKLEDAPGAAALLHAMHHYGWTVGDNNGGAYGIAFANVAPQTFTLWGQANPWTTVFQQAGETGHLAIPTNGISMSNVHILAPCVNTQSC